MSENNIPKQINPSEEAIQTDPIEELLEKGIQYNKKYAETNQPVERKEKIIQIILSEEGIPTIHYNTQMNLTEVIGILDVSYKILLSKIVDTPIFQQNLHKMLQGLSQE